MLKTEEFYRLISLEPITIKGDFETKIIWLNNIELTPKLSQSIYNHSPLGFDWGNSGAGLSQLALAVLFELTKNKKISMILHHIFKNDMLAGLAKSDFEIIFNAGDWFYKNISRNPSCLE